MGRIFGRLATRLALIVMGAGLAVSGIVLLLRAAWIAVAVPLGPMWASTLLGAILLAAGALLVFLSARHKRRSALSDPDLIALLTSAFLEGVAAGRSTGHGPGAAGE